jgi:hypothetical protein
MAKQIAGKCPICRRVVYWLDNNWHPRKDDDRPVHDACVAKGDR